MSEKQKKRYFWLKLKDDFFNQKEIKMLRRIAGGDTHTIIYLKMLLLSLSNDGRIYYDGIATSMIEEIALEIDEEVENVTITFNYLQAKGLVVFNTDDEIEMSSIHQMIGSESAAAARMRKSRERKKELECNNVTPQLHHSYTEIEIEKELDIEIEKEQEVEQVDDEVYPGELIQTLYGQFPSALLSKAIAEWVQEWDRSMINYAIEIAYEYSIEINKLKPYLNKIFENWKNAKFTTVEQAKEANRKFKEQHAKPKSKVPAKQEVVPKWLADQQREEQKPKSVKQAEPVEAAVSEDVMEARLQAYLKRKGEQN